MSNKEFTSVCKQRKIAFIGAGNMASAIINGWLDSGTVSSEDIIVFDVDKSKYDNFRKKGVNIADGVGDAVEFAEYVFLALKPAFIKTALENIMQVTDSFKSKVFISIAAAVPTTFICHVLAYQVPVIRVMPNTPMLIGHGAVAICKNSFVGKKQFEFICRILSNLSTLQVIEESEMNAIISVNGSSPAYVYLFVKSMLDSAVSQGISADVALPLILQSVVGSVEMIKQTGKSPDELIRMVATPAGTTLAALNVFESSGFERIVSDAMQACTARADEIQDEIVSTYKA